MKSLFLYITIATVSALLTGIALGQAASGKQSHVFHGKVEAVDESGKSLKVNGEEVKGWMAAMTMDYKVDNPAVLKQLKPGDQIMATVYDGDLVLHKAQVMPKPNDRSKSNK